MIWIRCKRQTLAGIQTQPVVSGPPLFETRAGLGAELTRMRAESDLSPCIKQIICSRSIEAVRVQNHPQSQAAPKQGQLIKDPLPMGPFSSPSTNRRYLSFSVEQGASIPIPICVPHASVLKPGTDESLQLSRFSSAPLIFWPIVLSICKMRFASALALFATAAFPSVFAVTFFVDVGLAGNTYTVCITAFPDLLCSHYSCYSPRV